MLGKVFFLICLIMIVTIGHAQVENLIENGSFEDDSDNLTASPQWTSWFSAGNASVALSFDKEEVIDGLKSVKAEILQTSATNWHIGLIQSVSNLDAGETYTLTFWAKAEKTRPIGMEVKRDPALGAWEGITGKDYIIQQEWEEYTDTFVTGKNYPNGTSQLDFWLAEDKATIWFDFVHVYEGDYVKIKPSLDFSINPSEKISVRWGMLKSTQ